MSRDGTHICSEAPFSMFFKKVEVNGAPVFSSSDRDGHHRNHSGFLLETDIEMQLNEIMSTKKILLYY